MKTVEVNPMTSNAVIITVERHQNPLRQDRDENYGLRDHKKSETEVLSTFGCLRMSEFVRNVTDSHKDSKHNQPGILTSKQRTCDCEV